MIDKRNIIKFDHPYSPNEINIRLQHFRVSELIAMVDKENLILSKPLNPSRNYQQGKISIKSKVWSIAQRSSLIESIAVKFPVPPVYLDGSSKPWSIIDGYQRILSIIDFYRDGFALERLDYIKAECEGKRFSELPEYIRLRFLEAEVMGHVLNPGTPNQVKYNLFKRINSTKKGIKEHDIRNLFFPDEVKNFVRGLAKRLELSQNTLPTRISGNRMQFYDILTSSLLAFHLFGELQYKGDLDLYISEAFLYLCDCELRELTSIAEDYYFIMESIYSILGELVTLFSGTHNTNIKYDNVWVSNLLIALYVNFRDLPNSLIIKMVGEPSYIKTSFEKVLSGDVDLVNSLLDIKSGRESVRYSCHKIKLFLNEMSYDHEVKIK